MHEDDGQMGTSYAWPGEDRTPTTEKEIRGFYSYSIAAEVFAVVGVGAFLPVTLEQLARENGVLYSNRSTPCVQSESARNLLIRATDGARDPDQCIISLFGGTITTASFAMYTFSAAVMCQALVLISVSAFADYGGNRKRLLLMFGIIGALASMSFMAVVPAIYLAGALLVIVGITCLGSSFTVLNSFLPLLAANHPSCQAMEPSLATERQKAEIAISSSISSRAVGYGYIAAILVQIVSIGILALSKAFFSSSISATLPLRMILFLSGLWWLAFMVPTALWLRERPGPSFPDAKAAGNHGRATQVIGGISFAWRSLFSTIRISLRLRQMVKFLIAWFLLSDAVASVSGTAVLFARTELKFGTIGIAMMSITVMVSGVLGSFLMPLVAKKFAWTTSRTIIVCLCLMELIPLYGLLGYLPFLQKLGFGGVQVWWEMYPLAFIFGTVMAGVSSFCRACYGQLIPPGHEAAFFALYAITDKGSSAIGPAVVGRIVDATGHIRPAFWFLAVLIVLPIPLLWYVDEQQGRAGALQMSEGLKRDGDVEMRGHQMSSVEEARGLMRDMQD